MKFIAAILLFALPSFGFGQFYSTNNGEINFISNAPLEIIGASSDQLKGIINLDNKTFAFKIYIKSFDGFNNPLQKEHFFENYLEARIYPNSTFNGKILEPIQQGEGIYRAKGILDIHGIQLERIIDVDLNIGADTIIFEAEFNVSLDDHNIDLPKIVYQKIAEDIIVKVNGIMVIRE